MLFSSQIKRKEKENRSHYNTSKAVDRNPPIVSYSNKINHFSRCS